MTRYLLSVVVAVFLITACTQPDDPAKADYWVPKLEDKKTRSEALKQLGKIGDKTALPKVMEWLGEAGPWQPNAAFAAGLLGDASTAAELVATIDYTVGAGRDSKTQSRNKTNVNVARALLQLGAVDSADAIVRLTSMPDNATRVEALKVLGKLGNKNTTPALIEIAETETQPFVRKTAIQALGNLRDPAAVPALVHNLYTELPGVSFYYEARFSLLQIGAAATDALVETLERKNQTVEAIRLQNGMPIAEGAIEGKAAFVLGALGAKSAEKPMIKALKTYHKKYQNREREPIFASIPGAMSEIAYSLGNLGTEQSVAALTPLVAEQDPNIRTAATEALTVLGARKSVKSLLAAAKGGSSAAKKPAIIAASLLGGNDALTALTQIEGKLDAKDPTKGIINLYKPALVAATECKKDAVCWRSKLADKNTKTRLRAAYELGWAGDAAALTDLLKAAEDEDSKVRTAAILSLSRIGGAKVEALQAIHSRWAQKIDYKDSNQALKRLIARLGGRAS